MQNAYQGSRNIFSFLILTMLFAFSANTHAYIDEDMISSDTIPNDLSYEEEDDDPGIYPVKYVQKKAKYGNESNTVVFNPRTRTLTAYDANGSVVRTFKASGGRNYCPDTRRPCHTPTGNFRVISKQGAGCRSSRYPVGKGGSPMPYCMFFSRYYAIHGSYEVPHYNASHGCIRVQPAAAKWLTNNFVRVGTKVRVLSY